MEYEELVNDVSELERLVFMKMDSYCLIEKKCKEKCLNQEEIERLTSDIYNVFNPTCRIYPLKKASNA